MLRPTLLADAASFLEAFAAHAARHDGTPPGEACEGRMKRYLRMGVYRGGRLVDDRYVPEKGEVSVGSSAKNTFALIGSNLPKEHVLVEFEKHGAVLHVLDGMSGELALDGKTRESVAKLQQKGRREQTGFALDLPESAKGWLSLGDATFFLQIAPKPPPPPKRTLPPEAKTGFMSGLETTFIAILLAVMSIEGMAIFAVSRRPDIDPEAGTQEDLDRFAEIIMPERPKDEPKKDEDEAKKKAEEEARKKAEEEKKKQAEKDKEKEKEDKKPEDPAKAAQAEADRKAKLKEAVSKKGLLNVIGAAGGSGALANVFASGAGFSDDIGAALAGAGGVKVATGDDGPQRKGGSGGGAASIGDLGAGVGGGGNGAQLGEKKKVVAPQISMDNDDVDVDSSSIDKASLSKFIQMRLKSVQQCYEKELKLNPSLKGKIVVRFVVTTRGTVGDVGIDQNTMGNESVAACITSTVKRWTFPFHPEEDSPVSFPFVFSPGG